MLNSIGYRFVRSYAVKTRLEGIDLLSQRVSRVADTQGLRTEIPLEAPWGRLSPIQVVPAAGEKGICHYHFGGLPALMQAVRRLEAHPKASVIYVNDGQIQKTLQSGHQGHAHPSEWTAEECSTKNLFRAMLRGIGVLKEEDPSDLSHYSYLHFPIDLTALRLYGTFFRQRLVHNLTAKNGVSSHDRWVCEIIADSLNYHQALSDRIEAVTGRKTFAQQGRVYWSPNLEAIEKKKATWEELDIACDFMSKEEQRRRTLLKPDAQLHVLKIFKDGKFYPNAPHHIVEYLQRTYPHFIHRTATVEEIGIDPTEEPLHVIERDPAGKLSRTAVATLFGSPGHSEVYRARKRMWQEVPVSGISSIWRCEVDKQEMMERLGARTDEEVLAQFPHIVAAANLSNLHVTTWDCTVKARTVEFLARATQGANFNSLIASKLDLQNMANNLHQFFIGDWTLISVGTCTRKTWVSNVPEFVPLGKTSGFIHGLSGLGYSASAAKF